MIRATVPTLYQPIFGHKDGTLLIEHPPLKTRLVETLLLFALQKAMSGEDVLVITEDIEVVRLHLSSWLRGQAISKTRVGTASLYTFDEGVLWVGKRGEDCPVPKVDTVVILQAHLFAKDPLSDISTTCKVVVCQKVDRSHWTQHLDKGYAFTSEDIVSEFPDQEGKGLDSTDPFYKRRMMLEDVDPDFASIPFSVFAKKRIFIRTDKPIDFLDSQQQRIANEQHGTPVVPFYRTPLQKRYLAMKRKAVMQGKKPWFLLLKYRRGGFTTTEQALSYSMAVTRPNTNVVTLADSQGKAQRIFRMVDKMAEHDPQAPKQVADSATHLGWENGSYFFIGAASSKGFARGDTLQRAHWSEAAFSCQGPNQQRDIEEVKAGLFGAASYGEIVLETTPNRRNWFYNDYIEAKQGLSEFTPIFVRWFDDPLNRAKEGTYIPDEILETITPEEEELQRKHGLDLSQIAFRRAAKMTYKKMFAQEFPEDDESCFLTSGLCYFDVERILALMQGLQDYTPEKVNHVPGGVENVYRAPVKGRKYVGGVDTSEGLGPPCDLNGIGILDKATGEQVYSLHGRFKPEVLAKHIVKASKLYNDCLMGVERNNHGHAVIMKLKELGFHEPHYRGGPMFYHNDPGSIDGKEDLKVDTGRAGWNTTSVTRPIMLDDLADAVNDGLMKIFDTTFLGECSTFSLQSNGKWEADSGCHDDTVIKWALAWQMRNVRTSSPSISFL